MSEGISLGVKHQMTVAEYSPKEHDEDQALDDIADRMVVDAELAVGTEALVMLAAHAPESVPTDIELEVLLGRIRDTVLAALLANKPIPGEHEDELRAIQGEGLEALSDTAIKIKDRMLQFMKWFLKNITELYKRLSDRLGRLSMRIMYVERKVDTMSDFATATDKIKLPQTANLLSLLGRPPANASEVLNALSKVKWLFTTLHNDYSLFQATFKRAIESDTRSDTLEVINDYLRHLSAKLNTRADSQRNGHEVFNQLPSNYIVEISNGASFTDCWVTITRTEAVNMGGIESRRADRASLSRMIVEIRNFMKVINELYGKVGSRLSSDFRAMTREAERRLQSEGGDARSIDLVMNWFTDQQNRLFYRSMMLSCATISAALDYVDVCVRRDTTGVGNEGLDESADYTYPISNRLREMDDTLLEACESTTRASLVVANVNAALEAFEDVTKGSKNPNASVGLLLHAELQPGEVNAFGMIGNGRHYSVCGLACGDYPESLKDALRDAFNDLSTCANKRNDFKALIHFDEQAPAILDKVQQNVGSSYVQFLLEAGKTPETADDVVAGTARSAAALGNVLAGLRDRTVAFCAALNDEDILVSSVLAAMAPPETDKISVSGLTAGWRIQGVMKKLRLGEVMTYMTSANMEWSDLTLPPCTTSAGAVAAETLVTLRGLDGVCAEQWDMLNRIVCHAGSVQGVLCDSMARVNGGEVDQWLSDGMAYLELLMAEANWQYNVLRQILLYRTGLILGIDKYMRTLEE